MEDRKILQTNNFKTFPIFFRNNNLRRQYKFMSVLGCVGLIVSSRETKIEFLFLYHVMMLFIIFYVHSLKTFQLLPKNDSSSECGSSEHEMKKSL